MEKLVDTVFSIEKGESMTTVAKNLKDMDIISSEYVFLDYIKKGEIDKNIQSGEFIFNGKYSIESVAKNLQKAFSESVTVRIPEGKTIAEIDEYLAEKGILKKGDFFSCVEKTCDFSQFPFLPEDRNFLEGYFFPATYTIDAKKISAQTIAEKAIQTLQVHLKNESAKNSSLGSVHEVLTMASIIEKESASYVGNESAIISGILWKRVQEGIPMGADATTRYILGKATAALTVKDLRTDNAFNTRTRKGLPPYPISSFSLHSLKAALEPKQTPYYFYLHSKGKIHYGKTNAEHEKNKRVYCGGSCE